LYFAPLCVAYKILVLRVKVRILMGQLSERYGSSLMVECPMGKLGDFGSSPIP
jgi:hypothetical protein